MLVSYRPLAEFLTIPALILVQIAFLGRVAESLSPRLLLKASTASLLKQPAKWSANKAKIASYCATALGRARTDLHKHLRTSKTTASSVVA